MESETLTALLENLVVLAMAGVSSGLLVNYLKKRFNEEYTALIAWMPEKARNAVAGVIESGAVAGIALTEFWVGPLVDYVDQIGWGAVVLAAISALCLTRIIDKEELPSAQRPSKK